MAWFPYITREEDYTSNPSNSICSNEYVCVREENASVSVTKREMVNVQFLLARFQASAKMM